MGDEFSHFQDLYRSVISVTFQIPVLTDILQGVKETRFFISPPPLTPVEVGILSVNNFKHTKIIPKRLINIRIVTLMQEDCDNSLSSNSEIVQ